MTLLDELRKPFDANKVHWRVGATNLDKHGKLKWGDKPQAVPLAYIDARDVMQRLDEICGEKWQCRYPFAGCCEVGIKINDEWLWRSNGAGATNVEAEKGQYSDSFKRAAVLWGVGQYLYDVPNIWMPINQYRAFSDETKKQLTDKLTKWQEKYFERLSN